MRRRLGSGWNLSGDSSAGHGAGGLYISYPREYNRNIEEGRLGDVPCTEEEKACGDYAGAFLYLGGNIKMKVYDAVKKEEVEVNGIKGLIDIMRDGRQVDLYLKEKKSDADGYMSWDVEHWSSIDVKRFIRCYSLEGRVLGESTGHNIYDLENEFKPEEAAKIELS